MCVCAYQFCGLLFGCFLLAFSLSVDYLFRHLFSFSSSCVFSIGRSVSILGCCFGVLTTLAICVFLIFQYSGCFCKA